MTEEILEDPIILQHQASNLISRIGWVIFFLQKKVKLSKKAEIPTANPQIVANVFSKLLSKVALAQHDHSGGPDVAPQFNPITSPLVAVYLNQCAGQVCFMSKHFTLPDLYERAFIPNTKFKRQLQQIGLELINDIASAAVSESVRQ
jgi:hypothetical protein